MSEFTTSILFAGDAIMGLGEIGASDLPSDPEEVYKALRVLDDAAKVLTDVRHVLGHALGELMGGERTILDGDSVRRRAHYAEKNWDHNALMQRVIDSVLVDKETGEIIAEAPLEKVLAVYGQQKDPNHPLPGYSASKTALEARGIGKDELDELAERRFERWTISKV